MQALLFPGQGSQFVGMGSELFPYYPGLTSLASELLGYDVQALCLKGPDEKLSSTLYTQPAVYVVNALCYFEKVRQGEGNADILLGHSLGEYNALLAAGVFDFETGLELVQERARLMASAPEGGMTAVTGIQADELRSFLDSSKLSGIELVGFNSPRQTVIAGDSTTIETTHHLFREQKLNFYPLKVSAPFHSRHMADAARQFSDYLQKYSFRSPSIPVLANATASPYRDGNVAQLLAEQIESPVRWQESVDNVLRSDPLTTFTEIRGDILTRMVNECQISKTVEYSAWCGN